jgi:hypothetical protein
MGSFIAAGTVKPSESLRFSAAAFRCDGGGPGGGWTSDKSGNAGVVVPLGPLEDDPCGMASEMKADPAYALFAVPFGDVGLIAVGDSASAERRLSREGSSRKLFDEARGEGFGRPSLLAEFLPNGAKPLLEGDGARLNPP